MCKVSAILKEGILAKKKILKKKPAAKKKIASVGEDIKKAYLSERDTFDDHGPAIVGNRLDKPKV
jgi:hypothetical protein